MAEDPGIAEFIQLREQKAADWRFITQVNLSMFAASAAILAAAITTDTAAAFLVAPVPLFLGVFHMIAQGHLHARLIAFLIENAPPGALDYEGKLVRAKSIQANEVDEQPGVFWRLILFPVAAKLWIGIALIVGIGCTMFPVLDGLDDAGFWALATGTLTLVLGFAAVIANSRQQQTQAEWRARWRKVS